MNFKKFNLKIKETLCQTQIRKESVFHGRSIIEAVDGSIFVDYNRTHLLNLEEAKEFILNVELEEEISKEIYEDIPSVKIANIIREHHDIKVTDTLIESYLELASLKTYTTDIAVAEIRSLNPTDYALSGKVDFVLNDGSSVAISESTYYELSNLIGDKYQLVDYMRESKDNFIRVVKELI